MNAIWEPPKVLTIVNGRAQLSTTSAFDIARQGVERDGVKTADGKKRTSMALRVIGEAEKMAEHFGLSKRQGFNDTLCILWAAAMMGLSRSFYMSSGDLSKAMAERRGPSAKSWARKRHRELIANEYDVYRRQDPGEQAQRLFREWAALLGVAPRKSTAPIKPKAESFERYIRELSGKLGRRAKR